MFDKIGDKLPQPTWLIQDVLPAIYYGQAGMIVGASGTGKSFIAIDWACSVASGADWQGHWVRRSKTVVYLCGEGQGGVYARILAWLKHHGLKPQALDKLYMFCETADLSDKDISLELRGDLKRKGIHPDLIIVDTLDRYFNGNSSKDVRSYINNFVAPMEKEFGATVVTVCGPEVGDSKIFNCAMDFAFFAMGNDNQGIVLYQMDAKCGRLLKLPMRFEFSEDIPIGEYYEPDEDGNSDVYSVVLEAKEAGCWEKAK